jgi:predicted patatin/cPLA2 family phospholipase
MIGIIDVGGGMRGVYGAGVLDYFLDRDIHFDYCLGVSSGSANIASFVARQKERNYRFYTEHILHSGFMGMSAFIRGNSFFNLDYIYSTLTNEVDPIDYDTILASKSVFKVQATHAESGKPHYFLKSDFSSKNCSALKASSAIPVACKPVKVNGRVFFDGGVSEPIPIKKAFDDGCEKVYVILTKPLHLIMGPEKFKPLYRVILHKYPEIVKALDRRSSMYNDSIKELIQMAKTEKVTIIAPQDTFDVNTACRNIDNIKKLYQSGYSDASRVFGVT